MILCVREEWPFKYLKGGINDSVQEVIQGFFRTPLHYFK